MPSPGISFGDLMVFIAVLIIVAVFLAAVRSFIKRGETPDPPQAAIGRDEAGEPNGMLFESAVQLVKQVVQQPLEDT